MGDFLELFNSICDVKHLDMKLEYHHKDDRWFLTIDRGGERIYKVKSFFLEDVLGDALQLVKKISQEE